MSETNQIIGQNKSTLIWERLRPFSDLPDWLATAREPELICAALTQAIPEFRSGQLILHQCDSNYIRYKAEYWTGFYELTVSKAGESDGMSTIDLQGIIYPPGVISTHAPLVENSLGSKEWHAVIPDLNLELWTKQPEAVLSFLNLLTDPEQSRQFLMKSIRAGSPAYRDLQIQACQPKVVRYKPGSRCTIVYHLDYPPGADVEKHWPDLVVAKTYRKEKGLNAYESMTALWNSPLASSNFVKIAEPLSYEPEMRIMLQGPIRQEKTLKDLTVMAVKAGTKEAFDELTDAMRKTARGLAELHKSGVALKEVYGWENDITEVREFIERLSVSIPQLGPTAYSFVDHLSALEARSKPDALVTSHGTFRPAQVLMYHGEIGFIDFDSCCRAEPAKDLGLFLCAFMRAGMATVDFDEIEVGGEQVDEAVRLARFERLISISEKFLDEYEEGYRPVNRQRVALFEALEIFTLILHAWMKVKVKELKDIVYLLDHFLLVFKILELQ